ncbi:MAG: IS110 family transposase [Planctomycetes bacterium]|nr:IS110 family transposase [Planctomycetota bacterium]
MRFYRAKHNFTCGVDLHTRTMYLCILDRDGEPVLLKNLPATPTAFLRAVQPYRDDLAVGVECIFTWYWLADLCRKEGITFVLGHALYMKAIGGAKVKNDRVDAYKIACLLQSGMLPMAYDYPPEMRSTRDLLRRRLHLVRIRGQLLAHIQNSHYQYCLPAPAGKLICKANREGVAEVFTDPSARKSVEVDFEVVRTLDEQIRTLELYLARQAKQHDSFAYHLLRSIPGVGRILTLTLLYEIHDIARFERVQDFISYARLIRPRKESAGKSYGPSGGKIGNVHLKWAFSEASVLFLARNPEGKKLMARLERKHPKKKALAVLSHKLGRAVWHMLHRRKPFDPKRFYAAA